MNGRQARGRAKRLVSAWLLLVLDGHPEAISDDRNWPGEPPLGPADVAQVNRALRQLGDDLHGAGVRTEISFDTSSGRKRRGR